MPAERKPTLKPYPEHIRGAKRHSQLCHPERSSWFAKATPPNFVIPSAEADSRKRISYAVEGPASASATINPPGIPTTHPDEQLRNRPIRAKISPQWRKTNESVDLIYLDPPFNSRQDYNDSSPE
jgi:hypothetical protein